MSDAARGRGSFRQGFGFGLIGFGASAVIALAYAPTGAAWFLSSIREAPVLIKRLAPYEPRDPAVTGLFLAVFTFSTALTAAVVGIGALAAYFLFEGPIDHPELFLPAVVNLLGYLVIVNPAWNLDTIFAAFRAGRDLFYVRLHQAVAFLALTIALRPVTATVWALIAALYGSWLTSLLHRLIVTPKWMRLTTSREAIRAGFGHLRPIVTFGLKLAPGSMAYGLSHEVGIWILGIRGSVGQVGAYSRAWMLAGRLLEFNYRLTEMLLPTLAERQLADDRAGFDRALVDSMRYLALALALPAAVGAGAATGIMQVFGEGFDQAAPALAFLLVVPLMTTLSQIQVTALIALDRPVITTVLGMVRLGVTIAASALLGHLLGITGVALGLLAAATVQLALQSRVTHRHLHEPVRKLWPLRSVAALAVAYGLGFGVARGIDELADGIPGTIAALAAGSLAYAAAALLLGAVLPRDRRLAAEVVGRVRGRDAPAPADEASRSPL